jgi:hypothetical protein
VRRVASGLAPAALGVALMMAFGVEPAASHHAFGFYEMQKTQEIRGTVTKYEWSNPHSWLFVTVPSADGPTDYGFEMVSVGEMLRRGWAKNSVKPGDTINVTFHPLRDGRKGGLLLAAKSGDGKLIGKPIPPQPPQPPPAP